MNNRINIHKIQMVEYIPGGYPSIEATKQTILEIEDLCVLEIGIPFSDPIGQRADENQRALDAGCNVDKLFEMVKDVRTTVDNPIVFATYANPVYAYGIGAFAAKCQEVGVDGILLYDVPFEESAEFEHECTKHDIYLISVLAPCAPERMEKVVKNAKGYLLCVPSPGNNDRQSLELAYEVAKFSDITCIVGS